MYIATKQFASFEEAIDEIFLSDSLAQSDLGLFLGEGVTDFESMNEVVKRMYEESKDDKYNTTNYPQMQEDSFSYTTYSGINSVRLTELINDLGETEGYLCEYAVESSKPLEYSSAMRSYSEAGWICKDPTRTPEEQEAFRNQYEQELIEDIRTYNSIPGIYFSVEVENIEGTYPYIISHNIGNDSYIIETLLQNHPELSDEIIEIINAEISEIESVEVPTTYNFNESVYVDSDFYVKKREEIIKTLTTIRDGLSKKKLAAKETEQQGLEDRVEALDETLKLIEQQKDKDKDKNPVDIGE